MKPQSADTSLTAEQILIDGYRRMSPAQRLQRVAALNRALDELAAARIRSRYGDVSRRELELRLAALRFDAATMRQVFDWDPETQGL